MFFSNILYILYILYLHSLKNLSLSARFFSKEKPCADLMPLAPFGTVMELEGAGEGTQEGQMYQGE